MGKEFLMSKQQLHQIWSARVAEFKASGQSVTAWCAEQDLKPHQLRYWLRKDRESGKPTEWIPLNSGNNTGAAVTIRIGQVVVEVHPGFDPTLLLSVWSRPLLLSMENAVKIAAELQEKCALQEQKIAELTAKVIWFEEQFRLSQHRRFGRSSGPRRTPSS